MSERIRVEAGFHLRRIQQGEALSLPLSRSMPIVGANCHELRLKDSERNIEWRIIYCIDSEVILVLEVFEKKTQETPEAVKRNCKDRLNRYLLAKKGEECHE